MQKKVLVGLLTTIMYGCSAEPRGKNDREKQPSLDGLDTLEKFIKDDKKDHLRLEPEVYKPGPRDLRNELKQTYTHLKSWIRQSCDDATTYLFGGKE